jgi:hypothetical protein
MLCHEYASNLKMGLDPVFWAKSALYFDPDSWQAEVLKSTSKRLLLNCSRQSGKSTITSILALHTAIYRPDQLILCLSPTLRQSSELFHNISLFFGQVPDIHSRSESALKLELENNSRIISLPGQEQTIRGYAGVDLLIVDEAARVSDDLYYSVRPMLAVSNGRLIALSTPFGNRGWFYESWVTQEPWQRWEIPASKCPRITEQFLQEERRVLGSYWFDQEYGCKFLDAQTQVFRREDVDAMFSEKIDYWAL